MNLHIVLILVFVSIMINMKIETIYNFDSNLRNIKKKLFFFFNEILCFKYISEFISKKLLKKYY